MLILERMEGESITITLEDGRIIFLSVVSVGVKHHRPATKIGIQCDRSIEINRTDNRNGRIVAKKGK